MGIQINGQTDTVTSTTSGGSVTVTPLAASGGLNVGTGASISSPATNVLTLGTNNTEAVRITSIGRVGIGTTNPARKFSLIDDTVYGGGFLDISEFLVPNAVSGNSVSINFGKSSSTNNLGKITYSHTGDGSSNNYLGLGLFNNDNILNVGAGGSIGIGITNPSSMLHLLQSSGNAKITIQRSNTASNTDDYGSILWRSSAANNNGAIGVARESAENNGYMYFSTGSGGTLAERARITGIGSFGIGTNDPKSLLHLEGSDGVAQIRLQRASTNIYGIIRQSSAPYGITYDAVDVNTGAPTHTFRTSADGSTFTPRVTIDSSGRFLVNTQTSYTYGLLTVQGQNATNAGSVNGLYVRGDGNANSCPIYFNDEFGYPQKSIYQEAYYLKIRGHNNEGVWILGSNAATNPSTNYKFNGTNNGSQCFNASNTTTWNTTSDQRIKENIEDLTNALDKIKQIRPVTFDYTDEYAEHRSWNICDENDEKIGINTCMKHHNVGYIAQEYKEVFPNDVTVGPEDIGDIHYEDFHQLQPNSVVPYLVKAVQELSAEVESLKAKIASAGL